MKKSILFTTLLSVVTFSAFALQAAPKPATGLRPQTVKVYTPSVTVTSGKVGVQTKTFFKKPNAGARGGAKASY